MRRGVTVEATGRRGAIDPVGTMEVDPFAASSGSRSMWHHGVPARLRRKPSGSRSRRTRALYEDTESSDRDGSQGCISSHTTTAAARQRAIGPVVRMPRGQTVAHRLLEQLLVARLLSERMVDRVDEFRHRQTMTNRAGFNNRSPTDRARANPCTHTRIQEHLTPSTPIGCSRTVPALQHALSCRATGDTAGPSPLIPRFPVKIPRRSDGRRG